MLRTLIITAAAALLLGCISPAGTTDTTSTAGTTSTTSTTDTGRLAEIEDRLAKLEQKIGQILEIGRTPTPTAPAAAPLSNEQIEELEHGGTVTHGPETAPVTIVEYSDFDCPFCAALQPALQQIKQEYGDQLRLVFRQFPLVGLHPNAWMAAEASLCAREQGKFPAMHAALFTETTKDVEHLQEIAEEVGLDGPLFEECLNIGQYDAEVQADYDSGIAAGVRGTPTMFINGSKIVGAVSVIVIKEMIDRELAAAR